MKTARLVVLGAAIAVSQILQAGSGRACRCASGDRAYIVPRPGTRDVPRDVHIWMVWRTARCGTGLGMSMPNEIQPVEDSRLLPPLTIVPTVADEKDKVQTPEGDRPVYRRDYEAPCFRAIEIFPREPLPAGAEVRFDGSVLKYSYHVGTRLAGDAPPPHKPRFGTPRVRHAISPESDCDRAGATVFLPAEGLPTTVQFYAVWDAVLGQEIDFKAPPKAIAHARKGGVPLGSLSECDEDTYFPPTPGVRFQLAVRAVDGVGRVSPPWKAELETPLWRAPRAQELQALAPSELQRILESARKERSSLPAEPEPVSFFARLAAFELLYPVLAILGLLLTGGGLTALIWSLRRGRRRLAMVLGPSLLIFVSVAVLAGYAVFEEWGRIQDGAQSSLAWETTKLEKRRQLTVQTIIRVEAELTRRR